MQVDANTRSAMPIDPDFDKIAQQLQPQLDMIARHVVQSTKMAMGEGDGTDSATEKTIDAFVSQMEAAQWQLKTPLEMLCAGVRAEEDVLECVGHLPNGRPDDRSVRLVRKIVEMVQSMEA
mmetsp:Transcript_1589/g.2583  ORF Transcript_1589/g.2583 Transcript_1589/m.2583 type:complete len:121 (+) Transcript_1589:1-363(+)